MSKRKPKTEGTEWLALSMASFNGSGYADKSSPEAYVSSYMLYKAWKNKKEAVAAVKRHEIEALSFAEQLVHAADAGHTPSDKNLAKFEAFKIRAGLML